jgi:hypothetical protein
MNEQDIDELGDFAEAYARGISRGERWPSRIAGQGFDYLRVDDFTPLDCRDPRNGLGLLALVVSG